MTRHRLISIASLATLVTLGACDDEEPTETCDVHEDCADTDICYSSRCHDAFGQRYLLWVVGASYIPATMPEGGFWDPTGGDPDPYLVLTDQDGNTCTSRTEVDSISPTWNDDCGSDFEHFDEETRLSWAIYEDDEEGDDPLMAESAEEFPITVENIRAVTFSNSSNGVMINFRIDRR